MAPLSTAINIDSEVSKEGDVTVYTGVMDKDWTVAAVPQGGYCLALILKATMRHQASTPHPDPIHVTTHYLRASVVKSFQIRVLVLKTGKGFSNLLADLIQDGHVRIKTHMIFGVLAIPSRSPSRPNLTISPPSPYARRHPLPTHPSGAELSHIRRPWKFTSHARCAEDMSVLARNALDYAPSRTHSGSIGGPGLEWGAWFELLGDEDEVTTPSLAFLVDIFQNLPEMLPKSERRGLKISWFPTMVLSIEFKSPIPSTSSPHHASRTVGLYSNGRFMQDPQGRHDAYVEVWTAPCNIGESTNEEERWRDKQVCLAVATQMALTLPIEVNMSMAKEKAKL